MTFPNFVAGEVYRAADANAIGLWLVKTQTVGVNASSVPVTDCFSANYQNYLFVYDDYSASANASLSLQFSNSTGSTYQLGGFFGTLGTATLNPYGPPANVRFVDFGQANTGRSTTFAQIFSPFASTSTRIQTASNSDSGYYQFYGRDSSTASNTGFTLTHSAGGTLTGGTIRVYGYRN
jgi:hypothetical protein